MRFVSLFVFLVAFTPSVRADVVAPPPPASRVAVADAIIVGRVVAHEEKDVETLFGPGGAKVKFRIALVNPTERILGAKEGKLIRVAYLPREGEGFRRPGSPQLGIGLDGLFFLTKHHAEDFYLAPMYFDFYARTTPMFESEVPLIRKKAKMLENPVAHLKAKNAEERFEMASMLISRYRSLGFSPPTTKAAPIAEEESKLILKALLDLNWDRPQVFGQPHPWPTFLQMGLGPREGWMPPKGGMSVQDFHKAARAWLEGNWQTYRIQRIERVTK